MAKYGFLDILNEEMGQCFPFDYEINWDKKNHAVEVSFLLEVQNAKGIELLDDEGESNSEDILCMDFVSTDFSISFIILLSRTLKQRII